MSDNKFNHDEKKIHRACGISDERAKEIVNKLRSITQGVDKWSELVEKFASEFTAREMAFIHVITKKDESDEIARSVLSKMRGEKKSSESNSVPSFLMGNGGEA